MAWADVSPKIKYIFKKISTFVNQTSGKKELQNVSKYVKNSYKGEFNLIITPKSCKIVIFYSRSNEIECSSACSKNGPILAVLKRLRRAFHNVEKCVKSKQNAVAYFLLLSKNNISRETTTKKIFWQDNIKYSSSSNVFKHFSDLKLPLNVRSGKIFFTRSFSRQEIITLLIREGVEANPGPISDTLNVISVNCNGLTSDVRLLQAIGRIKKKVKNVPAIILL